MAGPILGGQINDYCHRNHYSVDFSPTSGTITGSRAILQMRSTTNMVGNSRNHNFITTDKARLYRFLILEPARIGGKEMREWGLKEVMDLIGKLEIVRHQAYQNEESVTAMYSNFDPRKDARITSFSKMINVFGSVQLALTLVSKYLLDPNWWETMMRGMISASDAQIHVSEFVNFSKIGFVQLLFSNTESSLRLFLRALNPLSCNRGSAEFKDIYQCLFRSKLSTCPPEGIELLDLFRYVRNTIHNNGVYLDRNGQDATVTWRGESYEFRQFAPVDFVTWGFLLEVSEATRSLIYTVITDANLRAVTGAIPDPFSS